MPRTGRPRKVEAEQRSEKLYFRVTPFERAEIMAKAAAAELDFSDYARAVLRGAKVRPRPASTHAELVVQLRRIGNNLNQCVRAGHSGVFPASTAQEAEQAMREVGKALRVFLHGSGTD